MKKYEKEAFAKTFGIFFVSLLTLVTLLALFYYSEQKHILEEQIFTQMRAFTYDFKSRTFDVDIVPKSSNIDELNLQSCPEGMCGYFALPTVENSFFKVILSQDKFDLQRKVIVTKVLFIYFMVSFAIFIFAIFYSFYALAPLRKALNLLEDFLKDLIHDLATPVTSILLNTKFLAKKNPCEELERIELGAKTITSLYKNLEVLQNAFVKKENNIELSKLLHVRANPYQKLYPKLSFSFDMVPYFISNDTDCVARIFDNIISNACKYNTKNGHIKITNQNNVVTIEDTGVGIKNPNMVFERYYKESERGLGIGLNIVKKLCNELGIKITLTSIIGLGTKVTLEFPIGNKL